MFEDDRDILSQVGQMYSQGGQEPFTSQAPTLASPPPSIDTVRNPFMDQGIEAPAPHPTLQRSAPVLASMPVMTSMDQQSSDRDILANVGRMYPAPPPESPNDRGVISELGSSVARGAYNYATDMLPKTVKAITPEGSMPYNAAQSVQDWGEQYKQESPFLQEKTNQGAFGKAISGGVESAVQSVLSMAPGLLIGGPAGAVAKGVGGLAGKVIGALPYALSGGAQFGASQYQDVMERAVPALMQQVNPDTGQVYTKEEAIAKAKPSALTEGAAEFLGEAASDVITLGPVFNMFKGTAAKEGLEGVAKMLGEQLSLKEIGKRTAETLVAEVPTEMATQGVEQYQENKLGLSNQGIWDSMAAAFGPSAVASVIFSAIGHGGIALHQKGVIPNLENAQANPEDRAKAVGKVYAQLNEIDPDIAAVWKNNAIQAIYDEAPISTVQDLKPLKAEMEPERIGPQMPQGWQAPVEGAEAYSPEMAQQMQQAQGTLALPQAQGFELVGNAYVPGQEKQEQQPPLTKPPGEPAQATNVQPEGTNVPPEGTSTAQGEEPIVRPPFVRPDVNKAPSYEESLSKDIEAMKEERKSLSDPEDIQNLDVMIGKAEAELQRTRESAPETPKDITAPSGKVFKTEQAARNYLKTEGYVDFTPVQTEDKKGWVGRYTPTVEGTIPNEKASAQDVSQNVQSTETIPNGRAGIIGTDVGTPSANGQTLPNANVQANVVQEVGTQVSGQGEEEIAKQPWEMSKDEWRSGITEVFVNTGRGKTGSAKNGEDRILLDSGNDLDSIYKTLREEYPSKDPKTLIPSLLRIVPTDSNLFEAELPSGKKIVFVNKSGVPVHAREKFNADELHAQEVRQAISEGKPIPENVLSEYPDLKQKYSREGTVPPATQATAPNVSPWLNDNINSLADVAKKLGIDDRIEDLAAERLTANQISAQIKKEKPKLDSSDIKDMVIAVRAQRGIPSLQVGEEEDAFNKWLEDKNKRLSPTREATSTQEKPIKSHVVYSGLSQPLDIEKMDGLGPHFTNDESLANQMAGDFGDNGVVNKVRIDIKNPLRMNDVRGSHTAIQVAEELVNMGVLPKDYVNEDFHKRLNEGVKLGDNEAWEASNLKELGRIKGILQKKGYDGIVYDNISEGGGDSYIPFSKDQIEILEHSPLRTQEATSAEEIRSDSGQVGQTGNELRQGSEQGSSNIRGNEQEPVQGGEVSAKGPEEVSKQPWEMGKEEYLRNSIDQRDLKASGADNIDSAIQKHTEWTANHPVGGRNGSPSDVDLIESYSNAHKKRVEQALSSGKPVPESVLSEYPDLKAKYGQPQVTQAEQREAGKRPEWYDSRAMNAITRTIDFEARMEQYPKKEESKQLKDDGYLHAYYSPSRPVTPKQGGNETARGNWLFSKEKLSLDDIVNRELIPDSRTNQAEIATNYYKEQNGDKPIVLYSQNGDRWRGAVVAKSAKNPGGWQVSYFDKDGFSGDVQTSSEVEGVKEALADGFKKFQPDLLDRAMSLDSFHEGNEKTRQLAAENERIANKLSQTVQTEQPSTPQVSWTDRNGVDHTGTVLEELKGGSILSIQDDAGKTYAVRKNIVSGYEAAPKVKAETEVQQPVAPQDNPKLKASLDRIRATAQSTREKAQAVYSADRNENTARRARMAESSRNQASRDILLADTMDNIADAVERGEAQTLSGIRAKSHVDMLESMTTQAHYAMLRKETGSYAEQEKRKGEPATDKVADYVKYPAVKFYDNQQASSVVNDLKKVRGGKGLAEEVDRSNYLSEDTARKLLDFSRKHNIDLPWHIEDSLKRINMLRAMGITDQEGLRNAIKEYVGLRGQRIQEDPIKKAEREIQNNKGVGIDFFPTTKTVVSQMVDKADLKPGQRVLEPSAGKGDIAEGIRSAQPDADLKTVEQSSTLSNILNLKGFANTQEDFLQHKGNYDRILMNPPFSKGQDIDHVRHAFDLLNDNGRIVAIMSEGPFFRQDKKSQEFRDWLESVGGTSEKLPEKSFMGKEAFNQTGVASRMVVIDKKASQPTAIQTFKVGDKVEYNGEQWEVGFINNQTTAHSGTLRLQKSGDADAKQVNHVDPNSVKMVESAPSGTEAGKIRSYGFDRVRMSRNLTMDQLAALRDQVQNDPKSKNPKGDFNIYTPDAKRKLDNIAWAITYKMQEEKAKAKEQIPTSAAKTEFHEDEISLLKSAKDELLAGDNPTLVQTQGTGEYKRLSSGNPEWFKNKGYTKGEVTSLIDKAVSGKKLTERQTQIANDILDAKAQEARQLFGEDVFTGTVLENRGRVEGKGEPNDLPSLQKWIDDQHSKLSQKVQDAEEQLSKVINRDTKGRINPVEANTEERQHLKEVAASLKLDVVFWDTKDSNLEDIQGFALHKGQGTLFLNVNAKNPMLSVMGHETIHILKRTNSTLYNQLVSELKKQTVGQNYASYENTLTSLYKGHNVDLSREGAFEEFVADFAGDQFTKREFWNKLFKQDKTLAEKLAMSVSRVITAIKKAAGRILRSEDYFKDLNKAQDVLAQVMRDFSGRNTENTKNTNISKASVSDVPFSLRTNEAQKTISINPEVTQATVEKAFGPKSVVFSINNGWRVQLPTGTHIDVLTDQNLIVNRTEAEKAYGRKIGENEVAVGQWQQIGMGGIISLAKEDGGEETFRHETYHAAEAMVLTNAEITQIERRYGNAEQRAEAYAKWNPTEKPDTLFQKIKDFFSRIADVLLLRHPNPDRTFEKIRKGEVWDRELREDKGKSEPQYSLASKVKEGKQEVVDTLHALGKSASKIFHPKDMSFAETVLRTPEYWEDENGKAIFEANYKREDRKNEIFSKHNEPIDLLSKLQKKSPEEYAKVAKAINEMNLKQIPWSKYRQRVEKDLSQEAIQAISSIRSNYDTMFDEYYLKPLKESIDSLDGKGPDATVDIPLQGRSPKRFMAAELALLAQDQKTDSISAIVNGDEMVTHDKVTLASGKSFDAAELRNLAHEFKTDSIQEVLKELKKKKLNAVDIQMNVQRYTRSELQEIYNNIGSLKGFYATQQREYGDYYVRGKTPEGYFYRKHVASHIAAERLKIQLQREGYTNLSVGDVEKLPEDIYQSLNIIDMGKALETALDKAQFNSEEAKKIARTEALVSAANILKARGFRSHKIARIGQEEADVVRGYIEDPLRAYTMYLNQTSGGIAKGEAAMDMLKALSNVDAKTERRRYGVYRDYIAEQLRNPDRWDRYISIGKSIVSFKYLGLNARSALVNTTAQVTTAPPAILKYALGNKGSLTKILVEIAKAGVDYGKVMVGKGKLNADEQSFIDEMHQKGFDNPQLTRDALRNVQGAFGRTWSNIMEKSMWMFGTTEKWNRGSTMLAAYRLARKQGQTHEQAAESARIASDRAHGIYGKATLPMWAQGQNPAAKIAQMGMGFAKFSHNYVQMLYDHGLNKESAKGLAFALASPAVIGGASAFVGYGALMGLVRAVMRSYGDDRDPEKMVYETIRKALGSSAEKTARYGAIGAMGGDISGSLAIGMELPKNLVDLFGPFGGVAQDIGKTARYLGSGQPGRAAEQLLPTGIANIAKASREALSGATTADGSRVWNSEGRPYFPSTSETIKRVAGLKASDRSMLEAHTRESKREQTDFSNKRKGIYEEYRAYLSSPKKSSDDLADIMDRVKRYNDKIRAYGMASEMPYITRESLHRQAVDMAKPKKREMSTIRSYAE